MAPQRKQLICLSCSSALAIAVMSGVNAAETKESAASSSVRSGRITVERQIVIESVRTNFLTDCPINDFDCQAGFHEAPQVIKRNFEEELRKRGMMIASQLPTGKGYYTLHILVDFPKPPNHCDLVGTLKSVNPSARTKKERRFTLNSLIANGLTPLASDSKFETKQKYRMIASKCLATAVKKIKATLDTM